MKIQFFVICVFLCLKIQLYSQPLNYQFRTITNEDGLSDNNVNKVFKDSRGYLWFATSNGLNKYDGFKIKVYKSSVDDITSISDNWISTITEDKDGKIWVGTRNGLNIYDPETDIFQRFLYDSNNSNSVGHNDIRVLLFDNKETMWVGTEENLNEYNIRSKKWKRYGFGATDSAGIKGKAINNIIIDKKQRLWVFTWVEGIICLDLKTKLKTQFIYDSKNTNSIPDNTINLLGVDKNGLFWISTFLHGMGTFNPENGNFTPVRYEFDNGILNNVNGVFVNKNSIWVGSGLSVLIYNFADKKITHLKNDSKDPLSIPVTRYNSIYQDNTGIIWMSTGHGVVYYDPNGEQFRIYYKQFLNYYTQFKPESSDINYKPKQDYAKYCVSNNSETVWMATFGDGLVKYYLKTGEYKRFVVQPGNPSGISENYIFCLTMDKSGLIWIGYTSNGIDVFDPVTEKVVKRYRKKDGLRNNYVELLFFDHHNQVWIGENDGIDVMNLTTKKVYHYSMDSLKGLSHYRATAFCLDNEDNLWIGTWNGLNKYNYNTKSVTQFRYDSKKRGSINNKYISAIFLDSKNNLWIATPSGLNLYNKNTNLFSEYNIKNGFATDYINKIQEDNHQNLWLGTTYGLIKFNPSKSVIKNYDQRDGLFTDGAVLFKSPNGQFICNNQKTGFYLFYPDSIKNNTTIPPVFFTDFLLFNKSVLISDKNSPLKKHISETKSIVLNYDQSVISFEYVVLNYTSTEKNQFAYKLDGFDKQWYYGDSKKRFITYTNLDPGEYTLKVKGSNNDGLWNETGAEIQITILPPFWETWWFRTFFVILILGSGISFYRYRVRMYEAQKRKLQKLVDEQTLEIRQKAEVLTEVNVLLVERQDEIMTQKEEIEQQADALRKTNSTKDKFFSIISHDLKNPMHAIHGIAELLDQNGNEMDKDQLQKIHKMLNQSSGNVTSLLENLLTWARAQSGKVDHKPDYIDLNKIAESTIDLLKVSAENKGLNLISELAEGTVVFADLNMITTVIRNLINNAIKFTDGGSITIKADDSNDMKKVSIVDTGIGMSQEVCDKLFRIDTTQSTQGTSGESGTGLGLIICKEFVEMNSGSIWVESILGQGSSFIFTLPKSK